MKYIVHMTTTAHGTIEVHAKTESEAKRKALIECRDHIHSFKVTASNARAIHAERVPAAKIENV
jgi:hypothetical protein